MKVVGTRDDAKKSTAVGSQAHEWCESAVTYILKEVNTIQYLIKSIEEITGESFLRNRFKCVSAAGKSTKMQSERVSAGYMWRQANADCRKGDIVLLEEHIKPFLPTKNAGQEHDKNSTPIDDATLSENKAFLRYVERNLRHELIHAFDDARGVIEPANCVHQACSEIRAARLSGDCFTDEEVKKGRLDYFQGGIQCVRRRAILALEANPICRGFSERAVENTFTKCYSDYEPFVAPIYASGSYGDQMFPNGTFNQSPKL